MINNNAHHYLVITKFFLEVVLNIQTVQRLFYFCPSCGNKPIREDQDTLVQWLKESISSLAFTRSSFRTGTRIAFSVLYKAWSFTEAV